MKTFVIALLVLAVLISGMFMYSGYIKRLENDFIKIIDEISELVNKDQWDEAREKNKDLKDFWEKSEKKLSFFNDHGDLDEIRLEIGDLNESISYTDTEHSKKAIEEIRVLFERLVKNESFSLENILGLAHKGLFCHIML